MVRQYEFLRKYEGIILSPSPYQTQRLGRNFALDILKQKSVSNRAVIVALRGELGSGKTTFLQGFAKGLGVKEKITSPTFIVFRRFKIYHLRFKNFYHFDCYRLDGPKELFLLGWKEIIKNPEAIVVVEWADRVRRAIPKDAAWIEFGWKGELSREIRINAPPPKGQKKDKKRTEKDRKG